MKILLVYYTGTFNTRYITNMVKERFESKGHEVSTFEWNYDGPHTVDMNGYDMVGFGYPIYGFNIPGPFMKFLKKQKYPQGIKYFVYKNSGETYAANDSSSHQLNRLLKRNKCKLSNEEHFMMPYNIHFRYDDALVKEIIVMDEKLADVLVYEVLNNIDNIKKYKFIYDVVAVTVRLQYIGGPINALFMKTYKDKCNGCGLCIKQCPVHNIYKDKKGRVKFHKHCIMCMRCTLHCPKDAIKFGLFASWKVNGKYDLKKIREMDTEGQYITEKTEGFFKCFIKTYNYIDTRYNEIFNNNK
ncbi:MAG: EFR1 family ferrodoxin [Bacilli bacterium]|nr:EFR1 family ferrodoxin [Bacilli bacterium]